MVAKSNGLEATSLEDISIKQALTVGLAQAFAILPGISRSGSTISVGLFSGIKREAAATFSFLLALPAVGGATFLELLSMLKKKIFVKAFYQLKQKPTLKKQQQLTNTAYHTSITSKFFPFCTIRINFSKTLLLNKLFI